MSKQLRNILITLFFLLAANPTLAENQVKIGAIIPLTGPLADIGESFKNAIIMADESFDTENKVQFVFEDDSYTPKKTMSAFKKLAKQDHVQGIFVFGSSPSLSVADYAERLGIPMLSLAMVDSLAENKEFVVRYTPTAKDINELVTKQVKKRAYKTVAIVSSQNDAMLDVRKYFLESNEAEVLFDEQFVSEDRDFKSIASRIKAANPDAVYLLLMPPALAIFSKQLRALDYQGDFFGTPPLSNFQQLEASDGALIGTWYIAGDDRKAGGFYSDYQKRLNQAPLIQALYAYDIAKLLIEGVYRKGINQRLHDNTPFDGLFGTYSIDKNNTFAVPLIVKKITKDGFVPLG